jgi:NADH:ubiquinone oxidoreductase subunit H
VGHILLITVVLLLTIAFIIYGDRKIFAGVHARKARTSWARSACCSRSPTWASS